MKPILDVDFDLKHQEWQLTFVDYSCRLSLVRPNLMATDFPSRPRQHWLAARLNRDHQGSYLLINLSGTSYDTFELQGLSKREGGHCVPGPVMDIMMSGCVPPLEVLLRLVVSVHQWLNHTRHVVVVHGADAARRLRRSGCLARIRRRAPGGTAKGRCRWCSSSPAI